MPQLSLPDVPKSILATENYNNQESQVMAEGNSTYFIDRYEYPETGGILVHKYGGTIPQIQIDPSKYEQSGQECLTELQTLLKKYDFDLTGQDRQPVMLIPNEVIRQENSQEIQNRVDLKFPEKGFPDPLAVSLANKVKRVLKEGISFFSYKWTVISFSLFMFLPFRYKIKVIEKWLDGWAGFGMLVMEPRLMQPKFYTEFSRETLKFIDVFLKTLGISAHIAEKTAWIGGELAERDNAYRWRAEDIATETSAQKLLDNPRGEILRLTNILELRELKSKKLVKTANNFARMLSIALYHPRIRKAWNKALKAVNFKNFQYDDIDRHAVMKYAGYNFFGIPHEARIQAWNNLYNNNPPHMAYVKA